MNVISEVRRQFAASQNEAAKLESKRKRDTAYRAKRANQKEQTQLASLSLFDLENLTEEQLTKIEFYLDFLERLAVDRNATMPGTFHDGEKFVEFNPIARRWRLEHATESPKNRNMLDDVTNEVYAAFLTCVDYGADANGNLVVRTERHSYATGRTMISIGTVDSVDGLFMILVNWSTRRIIAQNSGSSDVNSTAEKGYRQAYGTIELEQEMRKSGVMTETDWKVMRAIDHGWERKDIGNQLRISGRSVDRSVVRIKQAAAIATKK